MNRRPRPGAHRSHGAGAALAALAVLALGACSGWWEPAQAKGVPAAHRCPQAALTVVAEAATDATLACDGAAAALAFLATAGPAAAPPIVIEVATRLPTGVSATAIAEYIAYVAMLTTMAPALRERVLARFDEPGFTHDQQINSMVCAFDPEQFGIDAWRHYSGLRDRSAFLRRVLDGQALREPRPLGD